MSLGPDRVVMQMLPDGRRMTLRNGPIDLVIEAMGDAKEVASAYRQVTNVFPGILGNLAGELDVLRSDVKKHPRTPSGAVAANMTRAAARLADRAFVTPMICVAGAVADHVLAAMLLGRDLERAYVNNGGDIALWLGQGQRFDVGICSNPMTGTIASVARISAVDKIGGIATSGWRGRSHSLGIADAVTVLARTAALADAAATLIANAIDLPGHPAVERMPANVLSPDSDLGHRLVTTDVGTLARGEVAQALAAGQDFATDLIRDGHILAAYGHLQGAAFSTQEPESARIGRSGAANSPFTSEQPAYA